MNKTIQTIQRCKAIVSLLASANQTTADGFATAKDYNETLRAQRQQELRNAYQSTVQDIAGKMLSAAKDLERTFEDELEPTSDTATRLSIIMQYLSTSGQSYSAERLHQLIKPLQAVGDIHGLSLIKELAGIKSEEEAQKFGFESIFIAEVKEKQVRHQIDLLKNRTVSSIQNCDCSGVMEHPEDKDAFGGVDLAELLGPNLVVQGTNDFLDGIEEDVNSLAETIDRLKAGEPEPGLQHDLMAGDE